MTNRNNTNRNNTSPPNIVLIMADQLAPHFCGTYGHPLVKTPALDALARRGMRFDAAYCNSPLCAPARFSFMAGQLASKIGAYDNAAEFPASIPTFVHYLRQMGYHTCLSGKMHFVGPDQLHGFEERLTTDIYPADFAWTPDWRTPDVRQDRWYHNMEPVFQAGPAATTYQLEYDEDVAFLARRRIFDYAMTDDHPFFLMVGLFHPHDPYVARPEWWNLYEDVTIDPPASPPADDPHTKRLRQGIGIEDTPVTPEDIARARRAYYANVSYIDSKINVIVKTLEEARLIDNTLIVVTSDHGDMLGERGIWYKMNFFEQAARVPLVVAGPGVQQGNVPEPVSLVDLFPTFLDIAGSSGKPCPEMSSDIDGISLWPTLKGKARPKGEVIGDYCGECTGYPLFMIRRGQYKYIHCDSDPPQLFDLEKDPLEQENLAIHPSYRTMVEDFSAEVVQRWDSAALREQVLASQRQRRAINAAMTTGQLTSWDYQPVRDASQEYVRNHLDWAVVAKRTRFPPYNPH